MINFNGMEAKEKGNKSGNQLPVGAYVCQVIGTRIEGKEPDQRLVILMDVCEGEHKGFYMAKYNAQKKRYDEGKLQYEPKFKGWFRLRIPNPNNSKAMYPENDINNFNDMLAKFGNSNPNTEFYNDNGFDEALLKGKYIGISVGEDEYNGSVFTKPMRLENVDDVRQGLVKPIERKDTDPTKAPMVDQRSGMSVVNTEKLPWDKDDVPY